MNFAEHEAKPESYYLNSSTTLVDLFRKLAALIAHIDL